MVIQKLKLYTSKLDELLQFYKNKEYSQAIASLQKYSNATNVYMCSIVN